MLRDRGRELPRLAGRSCTGVWRIRAVDLEDYIAEAYQRTAERIASGEITDDGEPGGFRRPAP